MLCYRCGSHVQDGAEKCWNCGTRLASAKNGGSPLEVLREKQRTKSRIAGVVYKIGDAIANRYQVKDISGTGGAGVVYRAHDQEIDVDVAVKVINAKLLQTGEEKRLFAKETKLARKLSHQNIVRIYDEGRDGDRSFYTMQFLEGLPLRKIIDLRKGKEQQFTLPEIEPIFNQLCQAVEYAHRTTYHGSLKPDNVIVLPDLLKVTDFGLLKGLPRKPFLAIQKSRGANFNYLAPEVRLEVAELTPHVDIYSLGVILWEMLTAKLYDDAKPEKLNIAEANVEPGLVKIIRRAVARVPKERYPTAAEMYDDLRALMVQGESGAIAVASVGAVEEDEPVRAAPNSNPAEAPTQRLDISVHGERPSDDDGAAAQVRRDELASGPPPPPPPESSAIVDAAGFDDTGAYEAIDDDMIEAAASPAAKSDLVESASPAEPPFEAPLGASDELEELSESEIELIADPRATNVVEIDPEILAMTRRKSDVQKAIKDSAKAAAAVAAARAQSSAPGPDDGLEPPPEVVEAQEAPDDDYHDDDDDDPTEAWVGSPLEGGAQLGGGSDLLDTPAVEPNTLEERPGLDDDDDGELLQVPLPDSAIPEPAFARVGVHDSTEAGRLDVPSPSIKQAATPTMPVRNKPKPPVVRGRPDGDELIAEETGPSQEKTMPERTSPAVRPSVGRAPSKSNGAKPKAKPRPMTRPRMSAIRTPAPVPVVFDPSDPSAGRPAMRPPTVSPRPLDTAPPPPSSPPPQSERSQMRLVLALVVSFIAVTGALVLLIYKMHLDQQAQYQRDREHFAALTQQLDKQNTIEAQAQAGLRRASADEAAAKERVTAATAAEAEAKAAADAEAQRKLEAEAAARTAEDEARKAAAEAKSKKSTDDARRNADAKRKEADDAAKAEKTAREREVRERKKREREEAARLRAEQRREREAEAAERAAERARRLREEREALKQKRAEAAKQADEDKQADAALERAEAAERKKKADAAKKAEEAREAAEAKKAAEAKAAEEAKLAAAAADPANKCPKGMTLIDAGSFMMGAPRNDPERNFGDQTYQSMEVPAYCIDYYESPNGRGRTPSSSVSQKTAVKMCKSRGKRLCEEHEWEKACKGPSGLRYPYGNQWDPARCGTEDDEGNDRTVAKSGTYRRCRSGYNVFDLSGNVAEWTATKWSSGYVVKGGSADRPGYDGRCAARKKKSVSYSSEVIGFRCCADPL